MSEWRKYRRIGTLEMRPYRRGDSITTSTEIPVSVSAADANEVRQMDAGEKAVSGFVARNPGNHTDQWFVADAYAEANYEAVDHE